MFNVYTDDQGNTYTILQLVKKVLNELNNLEALGLYKHDIQFHDENSTTFRCTIVNNHQEPYRTFGEFVNSIKGVLVRSGTATNVANDTVYDVTAGNNGYKLYCFGILRLNQVIANTGTKIITIINAEDIVDDVSLYS